MNTKLFKKFVDTWGPKGHKECAQFSAELIESMSIGRDDMINVSDLRPDLKEACMERFAAHPRERITRIEAVRELCGWHLGQEEWADTIIDFYENPTTPERTP